ncbi:hypothetical protein FRB99_005701 [Tulasnella sp. 403]|nr:hypothetical protein FRB99_005701 [Tulasnella sp. 403]
MAPQSLLKREVFVEIPPSPLHQTSSSASSAASSRTRPTNVPIVEIPHSPLWKGTPTRTKNQNTIPHKYKAKAMVLSRAGPLTDRNTSNEQAGEVLKKRKLDISNTVPEPKRKKIERPQEKRGGHALQPTPTVPVLQGPTVPKPVVRRPRKVVIPPCPVWKPIPIEASRQAVEDRITIREFFHRFWEVLKLAKGHRDSLDDFDSLAEGTAKALLGCLIDVLLADAKAPLLDDLRSAKSGLRKAGVHPSKTWSVISALREAAPDLNIALPSGIDEDSVEDDTVSDAKQFIPTTLSLIDTALQWPSLRDDLQAGVEECKQARSRIDEKIKAEKASWTEQKVELTKLRDEGLEMEKQAMAALKPGQHLSNDQKFDLKQWKSEFQKAESVHKTKIRHQQLRLLEAISTNKLRFTPAGIDFDGRVYYILSYPPKGAKPPTERATMQRWAWFLASWGRDNSGASGSGTPSLSANEDAEGWYGLYDEADIRQLVKWLEWRMNATTRLDGTSTATGSQLLECSIPAPPATIRSAHPTLAGASTLPNLLMDVKVATSKVEPGVCSAGPDIKSLCKTLTDFADFLEWRTGGGK